MNKLLSICLLAVTLWSCGINKQTQQIKALEKCTYKIASADQITIAGTDVKSILEKENINLGSLPGLALGFLRKDIPMRAKLNLEITNPTGDLASINEFEYKILINQAEIATGFVNQQVMVKPGQTTIVPVDINANVFPFLSNSKVMDEVARFFKASQGGAEQKGIVTLKIKPSFMVGNSLVKYPGFITIDKEVSSKILL
ncbi:hypothetical protein IWX76_001163 [Pedobacter sp. CAN_A7]|uniref:hypothetical protein n=1 Tax=Pedobacter sp. CAN_A7 TaxID=2787722 RepID=UPI0018C99F58